MKHLYFLTILFCLFLAFESSAQMPQEKVDGDKLIDQLLKDRYKFNKGLINGSRVAMVYPMPTLIFKNGQSVITFDNYDYVINNKKVVEVKGVLLSKTALAAITDKLLQLDNFQKDCSESVNIAYTKEKRDLQYIKTVDRNYFSALKQISSLTENIAKM